jgi:hypothetical protein
MSQQDRKTSGSELVPGSIFPVFKVNVPMPAGTAPARPSPPTDAPPPKR